jgi:hypothetical protein
MLARLMKEPSRREPLHCFISYDKADQVWAEWITWTIEEAGYRVAFESWAPQPGASFVHEIQKASQATRRIIVLLSEDYLASSFLRPEWSAALAQDAQGLTRQLFPIRIGPCEPQGLLGASIPIDLVDLDEDAARKALLDALEEEIKPDRVPLPTGVSSHERVESRAGRHFTRRVPFPTPTSGFRELVELLKSVFSDHELRQFVRFLPAGRS